MSKLLEILSFLPLQIGRILRDDGGNYGILTAIMMIPVVGISGLALDYGQALAARSTLQGQTDLIATSIASKSRDADSASLLSKLKTSAQKEFRLGTVEYKTKWLNDQDYEVIATTNINLSLARLIPNAGKTMTVTSRSVARFTGTSQEYSPPEVTEIDPDAWDYNRLYVYCYNSVTRARTGMAAIADNVGTTYNYTMPSCGENEFLSFRLKNIKDGRYNNNWSQIETLANRYSYYERAYVKQYYTDTVIAGNKENYTGMSSLNMIETALCDSLESCVPGSSGIGEGQNRQDTHSVANAACSSGKYMYYGMEDHSPYSSEGSDSDYNDIKIVLKCPTPSSGEVSNVRLIE